MFKLEITGLDEFRHQLERMARDVQTTTARLNRTVVDTPLQADENGFIDRICPSCSFLFKIAADSPTAIVRACPSCGHAAAGATWETPAQAEQAMANAREHATQAIHAAFAGGRGLGSGFGRALGLSSLGSINVMRDGRWVVVGLPARASATLRSERTCGECGCRFSFIGSAFFCPTCATSSADANFAQSIANIRKGIAYCRSQRAAQPGDETAIVEGAILEKAMADLVTSFQLVAEALYERKTGRRAPVNAFQRLDGSNSGDALWISATGRSYVSYVGQDELAGLRKYFQRRHLLAHKNGFVEQRYLDQSGDLTYALGQRLVVRPGDVEDFAGIVEKLVAGMRAT